MEPGSLRNLEGQLDQTVRDEMPVEPHQFFGQRDPTLRAGVPVVADRAGDDLRGPGLSKLRDNLPDELLRPGFDLDVRGELPDHNHRALLLRAERIVHFGVSVQVLRG